ncbi:MAG: HIT domain-containing protein [Candidatus Solibacter usitatus]|nr:HIT domain-containing protein [Candidatus Solibacter usitatus]
MDHLWSPWRFRYVSTAGKTEGCVFCRKSAETNDRSNLIVHRAAHCFVILNLFPYTTGHLMVVPYAHVATLEEATPETLEEMMRLTRLSSNHLKSTYHWSGLNIGMNVGECAGAGIAGHLHMHVLPRWPGDVNFMTSIGETRILPEDLETTFEKLASLFRHTPI